MAILKVKSYVSPRSSGAFDPSFEPSQPSPSLTSSSLKDIESPTSVTFESPTSVDFAKESLDSHDDQRHLAKSGKKQVLKRNFGFMSILGFSCTLMVTWEGLLSAFGYGLIDGGPGGLIYGFLFCWLGYFASITSIAEMASMTPTAAGQYHWTYDLAPHKWRVFLSYITGFQSVLAWQATLASAAYLAGTIIQGLIVLDNPQYNFERWHGTLLLYAVVGVALFFNTVLAPILPSIEATILVLHVWGFFAIMTVLVYFAPHASVADVFSTFSNHGGYDMGTSFFVGLLSAVFAFIGADGAVHMSEEIKNVATVLPYSLLVSMGLNGILGFVMLLVALFSIEDPEAVMFEPSAGFPFIEIFRQAVMSNFGAIIMTSLVVSLLIFATIGLLASASRQMWAFARDNGLPFSHVLSKVDERNHLPIYSIFCSAFITLLLGLINIASDVAFNAIASLVVAGYLGSYVIPITLMLKRRIECKNRLDFGPFRLGYWTGIMVNSFSLFWIIITTFFSFWPTKTPVVPSTMNWSSLLWGGTMAIGVMVYAFWQRHYYSGPINETNVSETKRIL